MPEITKAQAIKTFFSSGINGREVSFKELKELAAGDKEGFKWLGEECLKLVAKNS